MCADTGNEIIVEEFLDGEEASFFALVDGETCVALASAQVGLPARKASCKHKEPLQLTHSYTRCTYLVMSVHCAVYRIIRRLEKGTQGRTQAAWELTHQHLCSRHL
jgi:hypothetical protein